MDNYIEVQLPKCKVLLTQKEMLTLLNGNPGIFQLGLKRGKYDKRARSIENREVHRTP